MGANIHRILRGIAAAAVVVHVGLVAIHNMPDNPARQSMASVLDGYVGRYFSQNWRLFAPNPAASDLGVLVACLGADGMAVHAVEGAPAPADGWIDISAPLVEGHQRARLSAYDRLARAQINAARSAISVPLHLLLPARSCSHGDDAACEQVEPEIERWQHSSGGYLARVASSYCLATAPGSIGVAVAVRERKAIPWSQRNDPAVVRTEDDIYVGTFPIADAILPAPVYDSDR